MSYLLAIAVLLAMEQHAPIIVKPFKDRESCMIAAEAANRDDVRLQHPQMFAKGAENVCLKVERTSV